MSINATIDWAAAGVLSSATIAILGGIWWELRFLRKSIAGVIADLAREKQRRAEERGIDRSEVAALKALMGTRPCMRGNRNEDCDDSESVPRTE